jgi:hypothetical protein
MKCAEVINLLSNYLENDIDVKTKQLLSEHLIVCASCTKELEELKEIITCLKKTPEVQPPPYFLQAVHARLEKESAFSRILRKLFVPFYIKVPLEAIAVTATVIILVVLVQKSEIAKITPIGMPVGTHYEPDTQRTGTQEFSFPEIHPRETASQYMSADLQPMSGQQYGLSATESKGIAKAEKRVAVLEEGVQTIDNEAIQLQAGAYVSKDAKAKGESELARGKAASLNYELQAVDLAKKTSITEKEIILKAQQLEQDISRLEFILKDLGIVNIKIEHQPDKVLFSFAVLANQLEVLLSRLKDWPVVGLPAKDIAAKEETALEPISVKLTLTTQ